MKEGNALQHVPGAAADAASNIISPGQAALMGMLPGMMATPAQLVGGAATGKFEHDDALGGLQMGAGAAGGGILGGALGGLGARELVERGHPLAGGLAFLGGITGGAGLGQHLADPHKKD